MDFKAKLNKIVEENNSLLCVGLDVDKDKMPKFLFKQNKNPFLIFNKKIIDKTKDLVCSYKLNMAFYELLGLDGYKILSETINYIPKDIIVILDGKRNDIGNTAEKYAKSIFHILKSDATTINPYMGLDSVQPFLNYKDKCCFILCRTSNPSAIDFQDLKVSNSYLYEKVAMKIKKWDKLNNNCGAVIGATYPRELKKIRSILGENIPLLIPGVGKQGGDIKKTVEYGTNKDGVMAVINSSRGIIFAGQNEDFAEKSREKAEYLKDEINKFR